MYLKPQYWVTIMINKSTTERVTILNIKLQLRSRIPIEKAKNGVVYHAESLFYKRVHVELSCCSSEAFSGCETKASLVLCECFFCMWFVSESVVVERWDVPDVPPASQQLLRSLNSLSAVSVFLWEMRMALRSSPQQINADVWWDALEFIQKPTDVSVLYRNVSAPVWETNSFGCTGTNLYGL